MRLCEDLNAKVVAEGIETRGELMAVIAAIRELEGEPVPARLAGAGG